MSRENASPARERLREAIRRLELSQHAAGALYEMAIDPHGMAREAAQSFLASSLDIPMDDAIQALLDLSTRGLLRPENREGETVYFADYGALGLRDSDKEELLCETEPFEAETQPHSQRAMKGLEEFFQQTGAKIYLGIEVTSHRVFKFLEERAKSGKPTVFLMPRRSDVPQPRQRHYDEVLEEWLRFIKDGPRVLRQNIRIRITARHFRELYTSALSEDVARFDVYFLGSVTTRRGAMFQVKKETSLYEMIYQRYREALRSSCPVWRIWWGEAIVNWLQRLIYPAFLIIAGTVLVRLRNAAAVAISTVVLGLLVAWLYDFTKARKWILPEPFKK